MRVHRQYVLLSVEKWVTTSRVTAIQTGELWAEQSAGVGRGSGKGKDRLGEGLTLSMRCVRAANHT